jgi:hypothetical protein
LLSSTVDVTPQCDGIGRYNELEFDSFQSTSLQDLAKYECEYLRYANREGALVLPTTFVIVF